MRHFPHFALCALFALGLCSAAPARAADAPASRVRIQTGKDALGHPYWLYLPQDFNPQHTYWLVVGVHGLGGDGKAACGIADWAAKHDCIVLGPTMDGAYPFLAGKSLPQFTGLVGDLKKKYKLHEQVFVFGFSGGAQFSHRLLLNHPEMLAGCAAHAAGWWDFGPAAPDGQPGPFGLVANPAKAVEKNAVLRDIPFVVSCGMKDERLKTCKDFAAEAKKAGLCVETTWVPGLGHGLSRQNLLLAEWCFITATELRPALDAHLQSIEGALVAGRLDEADALIKKPPVDATKWRGEMAKACLDHHGAKVKKMAEKLTAAAQKAKAGK